MPQMNTDGTQMNCMIFNLCTLCRRYFADGLAVDLPLHDQALAAREGRLKVDFICGTPECAGMAQQYRLRERAQVHRASVSPRRERQEVKKICKAESRNTKAESGKVAAPRAKAENSEFHGRMPYKDDERDVEPVVVPAPRPLTQSIALTVNKALAAVDFETSANGRLLEFFKQPENAGKWFAAKFLEDAVGRTSGRMNNRAIWLRAQFNPLGLELDQHPCPPGENLPSGSYYRLCPIAEALRLSEVEKWRLLNPEPEMI